MTPTDCRKRGEDEVARIIAEQGPELPVWHSAMAQADWESEAHLSGLPKPYYDHAGIKIYHGDCREVLPLMHEPIRAVVTDPPYVFGIASTASEGKAGGWGDLMNASCWYAAWMPEARRLTANRSGCVWVMCSWRTFPVLARASFEITWGIESLLVWNKDWIGPGGMRGLRPSYELAALFCHDGFAIENRGLPDIWTVPWSSQRPNGHNAEKPVDLMTRMISASGDGTVLDPFLGSGTTLIAAKRLGRNAVGIEVEERHCESAAKRLSQEVLDFA